MRVDDLIQPVIHPTNVIEADRSVKALQSRLGIKVKKHYAHTVAYRAYNTTHVDKLSFLEFAELGSVAQRCAR